MTYLTTAIVLKNVNAFYSWAEFEAMLRWAEELKTSKWKLYQTSIPHYSTDYHTEEMSGSLRGLAYGQHVSTVVWEHNAESSGSRFNLRRLCFSNTVRSATRSTCYCTLKAWHCNECGTKLECECCPVVNAWSPCFNLELREVLVLWQMSSIARY